MLIASGLIACLLAPPAGLAPVGFLAGAWEGAGSGKPGKSTVERHYEFVLGERFLHARSRSVYPPQEKNPKGEIHEDWSLFSFDRARKTIVFRQFHIEGFVNQYVMEPAEPGAKRLVFRTESIENIAPGWQARETYQILGPDEFIETFELAAPGKPFEVYSETRLKRKVSQL